MKTKDLTEGEHVIYVRAYDGEEYSIEEFVIVEVIRGEESAFFAGSGLLLISLILVIIVMASVVLLYLFFGRRKRSSAGFIRL